MSILRSLNNGASGLRSHSEALGVTSDNIANVNTVGFKKSRGVFEDVLGRSLADGGAAPQAGSGSRLAHIEQVWGQGALMTTESPTDLALSGNGFFVVQGNSGGVQGQFYTRAGQFQLDADKRLVNSQGMVVQGYMVNAQGVMGTSLTGLSLGGSTLPARSTTSVDASINLDSNAAVPAAWNPASPETTSNFSTGVTVYDSLGNPQEVTVYFRKSGANAWEWHAMTDGAAVTGGTAGVPSEGASGTLTFNTQGALDTETTTASTWNFVNATPGQTIAFDFGTSITTEGGTGLDATTQFASPSTTTAMSQDGFAAGSVAGVSVESDGKVMGVFSNGQKRVLGQLAIATFASTEGLERSGQNLWAASDASGQPLLGAAQSGGRGSVIAGALEQSNVDLGQEFVNLISYQRGFQANSRVISTSDEMYSELVNLKR